MKGEEGVVSLLRYPFRIQHQPGEFPVEVCCFCGEATIFGCYVRRDPREVKFCEHRRGSED